MFPKNRLARIRGGVLEGLTCIVVEEVEANRVLATIVGDSTEEESAGIYLVIDAGMLAPFGSACGGPAPPRGNEPLGFWGFPPSDMVPLCFTWRHMKQV